MDIANKEKSTNSKSHFVGGNISEELYWQFKKIQAERRESVGKAIEIAIRLYIEAVPEEEEINNVR